MKLSKTWPKFRYFRKSFSPHARWLIRPFISDADGFRTEKMTLAGFGRSASGLEIPQQEELKLLLTSRKKLIDAQKERLEQLLAKVYYVEYLGIVDIDVNKESGIYDPVKTAKLSRDYAEAFAANCEKFGLGNPEWFATNLQGAYHADLLGPPDLEHVLLLEATRNLVRKTAESCGIPYYLGIPARQRENKKLRIDTYIDDSVLNKNPQTKGGLWRVEGGAKPEGYPKTRITLGKAHTRMDRDALLEEIKKIEAKRVEDIQKAPVKKKKIKTEEKEEIELVPITIKDIKKVVDTQRPATETKETLSPADEKFLKRHRELLDIWNSPPKGDRSYRDFEFMMKSLSCGAAQAQAIRLFKFLPGSKYADDERGLNYVKSIFNSAIKYVPFLKDKYKDSRRPFRFTPEEIDVLLGNLHGARPEFINTVDRVNVCGKGTWICERILCPFCFLRRTYLHIQNIKKTWPNKIFILEDQDHKKLEEFRKTTESTLGRSDGRKLLSKIRTIKGPSGYVICLKRTKFTKRVASKLGFKIVNKNKYLLKIREIYSSRVEHIIITLETCPETLKKSPWAFKNYATRGGQGASGLLPWLKNTILRRQAKAEAFLVRNPPTLNKLNIGSEIEKSVLGDTINYLVESKQFSPVYLLNNYKSSVQDLDPKCRPP